MFQKESITKKPKPTCGSCVHFDKEKLFDKKCCDLGKIAESKACPSHHPNVFKIRTQHGEDNKVTPLFKALREVPDDVIPVLAAMLAREERTRKLTPFKLLQPVVVCFTGDGTYVSNYCKANILDITKDYVRIINRKGDMIMTVSLDCLDSIFSLRQWQEKKAEMLKMGRLVAPEDKRKTSSLVNHEIIPTIDSAFEQGRISEKKLRKTDLVKYLEFLDTGVLKDADEEATTGSRKKRKSTSESFAPVSDDDVTTKHQNDVDDVKPVKGQKKRTTGRLAGKSKGKPAKPVF